MSQIKAGDMVRLVWGCCSDCRRHIGWTGTVQEMVVWSMRCGVCGYEHAGVLAVVLDKYGECALLPEWLIKIPPSAETQTESTDTEVTA